MQSATPFPHPLRPFQREALDHLRISPHVVVQAPTGSGKSRILDEWIRENPNRRFLLICPLTVLVQQHTQRLESLGFAVHSRYSKTTFANAQVWVASPESVQPPYGPPRLEKFRYDAVIIDECHCVWEWGHSFRPAFQAIRHILQLQSLTASLWLTATLTSEALAEIHSMIGKSPTVLGKFALPPALELQFLQVPLDRRLSVLTKWIRDHHSADPLATGVIFANARSTTERLSAVLSQGPVELRIEGFHAGLPLEQKQRLREQLETSRIHFLAATTAFGLGVDVRSLRSVILWEPPPSILALTQMMGRTGRDGRPGKAIALWSPEELGRLSSRAEGMPRFQQATAAAIAVYLSNSCRRYAIASAMGSQNPQKCLQGEAPCDRCKTQ